MGSPSGRHRRSEEQLAAAVVAHLRQQGWAVYQEVDGPGGRCDIVARREDSGYVLAVECKVQIGWAVIRQAAAWRDVANWVVVATPPYQRQGEEALAVEMLRALLMGWTAADWRRGAPTVREIVAAPLLRDTVGELAGCLRAEQRDWAPAGNAAGARFTDFGKTRRAIEAFVREHPHCTVDELLAGVETHYRHPRAARTCLVKLARSKDHVLGAVRVRYDGVRYRFYIDDEVAPETCSA